MLGWHHAQLPGHVEKPGGPLDGCASVHQLLFAASPPLFSGFRKEWINGRDGRIHNMLLFEVVMWSSIRRSFTNVSCFLPLKGVGPATFTPGVKSCHQHWSLTGASLEPHCRCCCWMFFHGSCSRDIVRISLFLSSQSRTFYFLFCCVVFRLCACCVVVAVPPAHADGSHQLTAFQAIFSLQIKSSVLYFFLPISLSISCCETKIYHSEIFSVFVNKNVPW